MPIKSHSGFTLLEIMVAVAILAMISVLSWQSMILMMNSQEQSEGRDTQIHALRVTYDKFFTDFSQAFLVGTAHKGIKQSSLPAFSGDQDNVNFATFSARRYFPGAKGSDQAEVGYFLESNPDDTTTSILMRRESDWVDDKPEEGGKAYPLLEDIKQIQFDYYDPKRKEWRPEWDSTQLTNHDRLPRAVRISITLEEKDREEVTGESLWTMEFPVPLYNSVLDF